MAVITEAGWRHFLANCDPDTPVFGVGQVSITAREALDMLDLGIIIIEPEGTLRVNMPDGVAYRWRPLSPEESSNDG